MFEILIDVLNGQVDYSFVLGLMISLTFQFLWVYKTELKWSQKKQSDRLRQADF
ncbi:hypothetical protein R4Z10_10685 [Niallia sp. XMNu-256]|uniref:hypothetical protein n=1 Tax=Niallia sp. XMNu-256 TaxID=3082444 RepID=UPI0030D36517